MAVNLCVNSFLCYRVSKIVIFLKKIKMSDFYHLNGTLLSKTISVQYLLMGGKGMLTFHPLFAEMTMDL